MSLSTHMNIKKILQHQLSDALNSIKIDFPVEQIYIERPAETAHGDYSSPLALTLFSQSKKNGQALAFKNPRELAEALVQAVNKQLATTEQQLVTTVTVAGAGFINFTLSDQYYLTSLTETFLSQEELFKPTEKAGSLILEYIGPNTNKPLHIGHLRNAALGSSMGRIMQKMGWQVSLAIINNDRGLHIIKSMWGYLTLGKKVAVTTTDWHEVLKLWQAQPTDWLQPADMTEKRLQKPDHFVGHWYQQADASAEDETIQKVWSEMLIAWEQSGDPDHQAVRALWEQMNGWFYQGFTETTAVLGARFDEEHISYESKLYEAGKKIILEAADKGIFEKLPDGAVKADLSSYKLPDKILLRRDGTGIYMTFDVELTRQRTARNADKIVWTVGKDQLLYFQQLFAVCEMLGYGKKDRYFHFAYGMVRLPEGKMSSRKGRVIYTDDLLLMAQEKAREIMQQSGVAKELSPQEFERVVQAVGVGAVKWTMLGHDPVSEIIFDIEESVTFSGFAGPYIQYTVARTHSVFGKAQTTGLFDAKNNDFDTLINNEEYLKYDFNAEERDVLVNLSKYFDTVAKAAEEFAPHHIATYLHELAQSFNTFYAHQKILGEAGMQTTFRLALTKAVQRVLTDGLLTLGIEPIERM